jgi:type VI protein secretion system component VasK
MFLDYFALVVLIAIILLVVYGLVAVWGIPHEIAMACNHPHKDAIGAATWVSLGTLGALWPFLWIWAMAYRPERGWGLSTGASTSDMAETVARLETRLSALERVQQQQVA